MRKLALSLLVSLLPHVAVAGEPSFDSWLASLPGSNSDVIEAIDLTARYTCNASALSLRIISNGSEESGRQITVSGSVTVGDTSSVFSEDINRALSTRDVLGHALGVSCDTTDGSYTVHLLSIPGVGDIDETTTIIIEKDGKFSGHTTSGSEFFVAKGEK